MVEVHATQIGIPGDAARKRGLKRIWRPLCLFGAAAGAGAGLLLGSLLGTLGTILGILLLILTLGALIIYKSHQDGMVRNFFKGARGEEIVAAELAHLPAEWTYFNGILLPDGSDVDHVAVGPQGIFVIETKNWSGTIDVAQGEIVANGRNVNRSPVAQVRRQVAAIRQELSIPDAAMHGMLCFIGPQLGSEIKHADEITVCSQIALTRALLQEPAHLDAATIARCVTQLSALTITEGLS